MLKLFLAACVGFFIPLVLMQLLFGYNTVRTILVCYKNHALFYEDPKFQRTYLAWLVVNPVDFAVFAGGSVCALFLLAASHGLSRIGRRNRGTFDPYFAGFVFTFFILYITGKNSGEVARLWIFLMPMTAIAAVRALKEEISETICLPLTIVALQVVQVIVFKLHFDVWRVAEIIDRREIGAEEIFR